MVANQNTFGLRAAIREVAKVHGIPPKKSAAMSALIMRQQGVSVVRSSAVGDELGHTALSGPATQGTMAAGHSLQAAAYVQNHFRHLSLHCGGVVIVPDEIRRYVPVEIAAKGVPVIQWEKDQTEEAGLVKIDLLGNRSLAVIRDALNAIARNTGRTIDYAAWEPIQRSGPPKI